MENSVQRRGVGPITNAMETLEALRFLCQGTLPHTQLDKPTLFLFR